MLHPPFGAILGMAQPTKLAATTPKTKPEAATEGFEGR